MIHVRVTLILQKAFSSKGSYRILTKIRPHLLLLVALLALIAACDSEEQPPQVISPKVELLPSKTNQLTLQPPGPKLYDANSCLKLSEILYEGYLYGLQTEDSMTIRQQSRKACKEKLSHDPNDIVSHLNLIGSKYLLSEYTFESLAAEKVEATVRRGVAEGLEEARLLMGMMVGNKYFKDPLHRVEILLPLLKSKDPRMLACVGIDMQLEKSARYDSLDLTIAYKYLPIRLFEEAKSLNNIMARNYGIVIPYRQNFNYKLAALAFERAYSINQDILSGFELARAFMDGQGVKRNTAKALELLHSVIERGSPKGYSELALIYSIFTNIGNEVDGFTKDEHTSIYYFEEAAKRGDNVSRAALANIYLDDSIEYYNESRGVEIFCQIPPDKRQRFSVITVLGQKAITVKCETDK